MKMIPRYLKEEIGNELDEDLTATSPTVSRTLDCYMKRMLDTEEHTTEDYGWLEPSGKFHAVEWGEHQKWAYEYLKRSSMEEKMPILYEAGDVLTKKGWILLHNLQKHRKSFYLVITWRETAKKKLMKFGGNKYNGND